MIRSWPLRLLGVVAVLPWWLTATGHTQESGLGCNTLGRGRGCQTARQTSPDAKEAIVLSAPSRPIVTYTNGRLTVTAWNTSLAEVLRAISAQTGIVIDFSAGNAADHIFVREGPGTTRHVIANLLNGSGFNYVILALPGAPDELTRVVLAKADQPSNFSPPPASDGQGLAEDQPTATDPLLWTPASDSSLLATPEDPTSTVLPKAADGESLQPPKDPIAPEVLEQMMKDRARQLHEQVQQPQ